MLILAGSCVPVIGRRFPPWQMRLWHLPCQRTTLGCNLVSTVSIGVRTRIQAHLVGTWPTIPWNAYQSCYEGSPVEKEVQRECVSSQ